MIATASLHLAGKVEETPQKLSRVIEITHRTRNPDKPPLDAQALGRLKEKILIAERVILHTIAFDLSVDHPYKYLLQLVKKVKGGDKVGSKQLAQASWNFVNDSYGTDLCLRFQPRDIACSSVFLAGKYLECEANPQGQCSSGSSPSLSQVDKWPNMLQIDDANIYEILMEILDLYKNGSKTTLKKLRQELSPQAGEILSPLQNPSKRQRTQ